MSLNDDSNGYDAIAVDYVAARVKSNLGKAQISDWARTLPECSEVLDCGCGNGQPVTEALLNAGHSVYAIDASAAMLRLFRERFPQVPTSCEPIEATSFFGRSFDGVTAIGLLFLLPESEQRRFIRRVGDLLRPAGRFLFSAPRETGEWDDLMTGRRSRSLGQAEYVQAIESGGMRMVDSVSDEGGNHYYICLKSI